MITIQTETSQRDIEVDDIRIIGIDVRRPNTCVIVLADNEHIPLKESFDEFMVTYKANKKAPAHPALGRTKIK